MTAAESARDRAAKAAYLERLAFGATEGRRCQYRSYWDGDMPEDRKARDYAIVDAVLAEYQDTALAVLRELVEIDDHDGHHPIDQDAWARARALLAEHTTKEE